MSIRVENGFIVDGGRNALWAFHARAVPQLRRVLDAVQARTATADVWAWAMGEQIAGRHPELVDAVIQFAHREPLSLEVALYPAGEHMLAHLAGDCARDRTLQAAFAGLDGVRRYAYSGVLGEPPSGMGLDQDEWEERAARWAGALDANPCPLSFTVAADPLPVPRFGVLSLDAGLARLAANLLAGAAEGMTEPADGQQGREALRRFAEKFGAEAEAHRDPFDRPVGQDLALRMLRALGLSRAA